MTGERVEGHDLTEEEWLEALALSEDIDLDGWEDAPDYDPDEDPDDDDC